MTDAGVGDVVNRKPDAEKGWFEVAAVDTLFDGQRQLTDSTGQVSIAGWDFDLVGLQVAEKIEVGSQSPATPPPDQADPVEPETEPESLAETPEPTSETELQPETEPDVVPEVAVSQPEQPAEPEPVEVPAALAPQPDPVEVPAALAPQPDPVEAPAALAPQPEERAMFVPQAVTEPPADTELATEDFPGSDKSPVMAPGAGPSLPSRR